MRYENKDVNSLSDVYVKKVEPYKTPVQEIEPEIVTESDVLSTRRKKFKIAYDNAINEYLNVNIPVLESDKKGYWYCENCDEKVDPEDVTYEETHDTRSGGCGKNVEYKD